jgi:hypothetical protein
MKHGFVGRGTQRRDRRYLCIDLSDHCGFGCRAEDLTKEVLGVELEGGVLHMD